MCSSKELAEVSETMKSIVEIAKNLYDRRLTFSDGGNVSARIGDRAIITPHGSALRRWKINTDDLVIVDLQGNVIKGETEPSWETNMHLEIYNQVKGAGAVIHAHPEHLLGFSLVGKIPTLYLVQFEHLCGEISVLEFASAASKELAKIVASTAKRRENELKKHGLVFLLPRHGAVSIGKDLNEAFSALETANEQAWAWLASHLQGKQ